MPTILDSFLFEIGWKTDDFNKDGDQVIDKVDKTGDSVEKQRKRIEANNKRSIESFRSVKNEVLGVALAFAGASSVKAFVQNIVDGDAATKRLADRLGVATDKLGVWQNVARQNGGNPLDANNTYQTLIDAAEQTRLTGQMPNALMFSRLGISPADLNAGPDVVLQKMAQASSRFSPRDFSAIVGQTGVSPSIVTALQKGPAALAAVIAAQDKLGHVTDTTGDAMIRYQQAVNDVTTELNNAFRPALARTAEVLAKLLQLTIEHKHDPKNDWFDWLNDAVKRPVDAVGGMFSDLWHGATSNPYDKSSGSILILGPDGKPMSLPSGAHGTPGGAWTTQQLAAVAAGIHGATIGGLDRSTAREMQLDPRVGRNSQHVNDQGHPATAIDLTAPGYSANQIREIFAKAGATVEVLYDRNASGSGYHYHIQAPRALLAASRHLQAARAASRHLQAARAANAGRGVTHRSSSSQTHIGTINVQTKATDAKGVAASLPGAIQKRTLTTQANTGLN